MGNECKIEVGSYNSNQTGFIYNKERKNLSRKLMEMQFTEAAGMWPLQRAPTHVRATFFKCLMYLKTQIKYEICNDNLQ